MPGRKTLGWFMLVPALACVAMVVGGYFDRVAVRYADATGPRQRNLVAVYFSGDMGLDVGTGDSAIQTLRAAGVPVLSINSSALFLGAHDRAYVDNLVAESIRDAMARSHAARVALVGFSFGADILDTGVGALPSELRRHITSVVLLVPGTDVFFHANPTGLFYMGQPDSDPRRTVRTLRGLPVTCVFGSLESDSLCRTPELARAARVALDDGHLMFGHYQQLADITARAAIHPPVGMR